MANQGAAERSKALGMPARFSRALQVALAAPAQALAVDVGAVVPATVALGMGTRRDIHLGRTFRPMRSCTGCDEHVLQLLAEPGDRVVCRAGGPDVELRGQRRAD